MLMITNTLHLPGSFSIWLLNMVIIDPQYLVRR